MSCQAVIQVLKLFKKFVNPPTPWNLTQSIKLSAEKCRANVLKPFFPPVQASFQRSNSHDKVRKIVAEEGRTARNLIAWSVPLENKEEEGRLLRAKQTVHIYYYASDSVFALRQVLHHCISDSNWGTYEYKQRSHSNPCRVQTQNTNYSCQCMAPL